MTRKSNAAGVYSASGITLSDGDEADFQFDNKGSVKVAFVASSASLPSTGANNQITVATGTSTALPSNSLTQGVILRALSTNSVSIYVGFVGTTVANGHELLPGESTSVAVSNTNAIYAISGTASQGLCFVGS